jgi:hypothetical protein
VIAQDSKIFPSADDIPTGMQRLQLFGSTQIWHWQREVSDETIDATPDVVIRQDLDKIKKESPAIYKYFDDFQHWWPVLHSKVVGSTINRSDAYTDPTLHSVDWNYLLVRQANRTQIEALVRISAQLVARCAGLTEAVRRCQNIMSNLPALGDNKILQRSVGELEVAKRTLLVDLVTSDARPNVYGSFAFAAYSEIRRVWNIEEIEISSKRCLEACESILAEIRQTSESRGEKIRADTLLFLTVISSVSAIFSFVDYLGQSESSGDPVRLGVSIVIAVAAGLIFFLLRRFNSD